MKGSKQYRFKDNPKEKEFHDKFVEKFNRNDSTRRTFSAIVNGWSDDRQNQPKEYLSKKEETICVNLVQWLGSPVGKSFLEDCGFTEKPIKESILHTVPESCFNEEMAVTSCCKIGPIVDENFCPSCGSKIKRDK